MKNLIIVLSLVLLLSACGSTDTLMDSEFENAEANNNQETAEFKSESTGAASNQETVESSEETTQKEEGAEQSKIPVIELGEIVVIDDFAEITITSNVFGNRIDPPNPDSFYSYYENKEPGEIFLDTVISVKNLLPSAKTSDEFVNVKIIYDNKYEYRTFSIIEEEGGSDFTYTNITSIEPLKTGVLHFLASIPSDFETDGKPLKALITINGKDYEQIIR